MAELDCPNSQVYTKEERDEFAIGFAEWANENYFSLNTYKKTVTLKELLEIYKKEKGL